MRKFVMSMGVALVATLSVLGYAGWNNRPFNPANTEYVYANPGGEIFSFIEKYGTMASDGKYLKIDGLCASACTYFLNALPRDRVCATPRSSFGFHGVYLSLGGLGRIFDKTMTQLIMPIVYPEFVLNILKERGFDGSEDIDETKYPTGFIWLTPKELNIKEC